MKRHALLPLLIAFCLPAAAMASYVGPVAVIADDQGESAVSAETDAEALSRYDILSQLSANHPNERFRLYGQRSAAQKQWTDAARSFRTAARYADKYSQHRLSMMYWHGVGVPTDRVEAYLWSDLAAERGYPQFLAIRERMWRELDPQQQAEVAQRGPRMLAEYGDATAKPRFDMAMLRGRAQVTGSRTGHVGKVGIVSAEALLRPVPMLENLNDVLLRANFYARTRNDPKQYWINEDRAWNNGMVEVGELEQVDAAKP